MAFDRYPRMVDLDAGKQAKVNNADEHKAKFPEDYAKLVEEMAGESKEDVRESLACAKVREQCARIAETMERGNKLGTRIAVAIRAGGPSAEEIERSLATPNVAPPAAPVATKPLDRESAADLRNRVEAQRGAPQAEQETVAQ